MTASPVLSLHEDPKFQPGFVPPCSMVRTPPCFQVPEAPGVVLCRRVHTEVRGQPSNTGFLHPPHRFWETPVLWLGGKHSYMRSHLTGSIYFFSSMPGTSPPTGSQIPTLKCAGSLSFHNLREKPWSRPSICWCPRLALLTPQCPVSCGFGRVSLPGPTYV